MQLRVLILLCAVLALAAIASLCRTRVYVPPCPCARCCHSPMRDGEDRATVHMEQSR